MVKGPQNVENMTKFFALTRTYKNPSDRLMLKISIINSATFTDQARYNH